MGKLDSTSIAPTSDPGAALDLARDRHSMDIACRVFLLGPGCSGAHCSQ
jgi:hypothetical protein